MSVIRVITRPHSLIFALLLLSGCGNLSQLQETNLSDDGFSGALASEYLSYAESEEEQGRYFSANYYAGKGLKAAAGKEVLPDELEHFLPERSEESLHAARTDLMNLLTDDVKHVRSQNLARLQLLFDCWQQQETRFSTSERETSCAEEFKPAVIELQNVAQQILYSQVKRYLLSFRYNSVRPTSISKRKLHHIVDHVSDLSEFLVVVQAGTATGVKQRALQDRRQAAVVRSLLRAGISEEHVRTYSQGDVNRVHLLQDDAKPMRVDEKKVLVIVKTPKKNKE